MVTYTSRALWFLSVNLMKQAFQSFLERLVLSALIELADEMAAGFQCLEAELECGSTKVLDNMPSASGLFGDLSAQAHHAPCMITKTVATRIHHPKIWVGQRSLPEAYGLLPGFAHVT